MGAVRLLALLLTFCYANAFASGVPTSVVFQGKILQPGDVPLEAASVDFNIRILDPGAGCILHEENFTGVDMTNSDGLFSLDLGTGTRVDGQAHSFLQSFENNRVFPATGPCGAGYTPTTGDHRLVRLQFDAGTPIVVTPNAEIKAVPYAYYAESLQGMSASEFLQVNTGGANVLSQANLQGVFSTPNYTELLALLAGTSSNYMQTSPGADVSFNNNKITDVSDPTNAQDASTKNYADTNVGGTAASVTGVSGVAGDGRILTWDQGNARWEAKDPAFDGSDITTGTIDKDRLPTTMNAITMSGDLDMNGNNILNSGYITMNDDTYLHLGRYDDTAENALVTTPLTAAHEGVMWYDEEDDTIEYWDGTAVVVVGAGAGSGTLDDAYDNGAATVTVDGTGGGDVVWNLTSTNDFKIQDAGADAFVVLDNGNVGIGLSNPDDALDISGGNLNVSGGNNIIVDNGYISANFGGSYKVAMNAQTADGYISIRDSTNTTRVGLDSNGNSYFTGGSLGVGLIDPLNGDLDGTPAISISGTAPRINLNQSADLNANGTLSELVFGGLDPRTSSSVNGRDMAAIEAYWTGFGGDTLDTDLIFRTSSGGTSSAEKMRILSTGEVGIGTATPGGKLHVSGGELILDGTGAYLDYKPNNTACSNNEVLKWSTANDRWECGTDNAGAGAQTMDETYDQGTNTVAVDAQDMIWNLTSTQDFRVQDNGTDAFVVLDDGSVGVGTSTPTGDFNVVGATGTSVNIGPASGASGNAVLNLVGKSSGTSNTVQIWSDFSGNVNFQPDTGQHYKFRDGTGTEVVSITAAGALGVGTTTPTTGTIADFAGAGAAESSIIIPRDTTANRPGTGVNGMLRYNTTSNKFEGYEGGAWVDFVQAAGSSNTLDGAYDEGGAGAGRAVTVDTGAVQFTGSNAADETVEITNSGNGGGLLVENTGTGLTARFNDEAADTSPVVIDDAGNVGVGITSLTRKFEVEATGGLVARFATGTSGGTPSGTWGELLLESSEANFGMQFLGTNTSNQRILFGDAASSTRAWIEYDHTADFLATKVAGAERMRINSSGNVGIGTSTPGRKLEVNTATAGNELLVDSNTYPLLDINGASVSMQPYPTGNPSITLSNYGSGFNLRTVIKTQRDGTNSFPHLQLQPDGGRVGVGTTTPTSLLDIEDTGGADVALDLNSANTAQNQIRFGDTDDNYVGGVVYQHADDSLYLFAGNNVTHRIHIEAGGSVGVGTAAPTAGAILDVAGTGAVQSSMIIPRDTTANRPGTGVNGMLRYNTTSNKFEGYEGGAWVDFVQAAGSSNTLDGAYDEGGAGAGRVITVDTGAVQFTGSNAADETVEITNSGNGGALLVENTGTGTSFRVNDEASDTSPFFIADDGQVGVGTVSPATNTKMDVHGTIMATGGQGVFTGLSALSQNFDGLIIFGGDNGGSIYARGNVAGGDDNLRLRGFTDVEIRTTPLGVPTTQLIVKNDGKVGVGTVTPDSDFHLYSTDKTTINIESDDDDNYPQIKFTDRVTTTGDFSSYIAVDHRRTAGDFGAALHGLIYKSGRTGFANHSFLDGADNVQMAITDSGKVGVGTAAPTAGALMDFTGTGVDKSSILLPRDTTANRPTTGVNGMIRYNVTTNTFEGYENGAWVDMRGGGSFGTGNSGFVGAIKYASTANCIWNSTSGVYADFATDSDCASPTVEGAASAPDTAKTPAVKFASLPAGRYRVIASGALFYSNTSATTHCSWTLSDGTTRAGSGWTNDATAGGFNNLVGEFSYSSVQTNITFDVQAWRLSGTSTCEILSNSFERGLAISVERIDGNGSAIELADNDGDTRVQVEESSDEDIIRFDTAGTERMNIDASGNINVSGGFIATGTVDLTGATITDGAISVDDLDFASAAGGINIPQLASAPTGSTEGQMYFNTGDKKLYVWNGTAWTEVGSGSGGGGGIFVDNLVLADGVGQTITSACTAYTDVTNSGKNVTFPEGGEVVVNFSMGYYGSSIGVTGYLRACIDADCGGAIRFFANEANSHKVVPAASFKTTVTAGTKFIKLQACLAGGTSIVRDGGDGLQWNVVAPGAGGGGGSSSQGPSFAVHKNGTDQSVVANTQTTLTWSTEDFDTHSDFASNRFTPSVAGRYLITAKAYCKTANTVCFAYLTKNGTTIASNRSSTVASGGYHAEVQVTKIVDMNGTTDYIEADALDFTGTTISGVSSETYFTGSYIGSSTGLGDSNGIDVPTLGSAPSSPDQGQMYYNTGDDKLYVWDGSAWKEVGSGASATSEVAFSVHRGGVNQTIPSSTETLVTWNTEEFDTNNNFSGNRFTPTVAGKYIVTGTVFCQTVTGGCQSLIRKNGATIAQNYSYRNASNAVSTAAQVVDMNGTTDYLELAAVSYGGTTLLGNSNATKFSGALLSGGSTLGDSNGVDVPTLASAPSSPDQGQMYYNTGDDKLYVWDGSAWKEVGSGAGGSSDASFIQVFRNGTVNNIGTGKAPLDTVQDSNGSNITANLANDWVTLKAGSSYLITARMKLENSSPAASFVNYAIRDFTAGANIGVYGANNSLDSNTPAGSMGHASAVFKPSVDTDVGVYINSRTANADVSGITLTVAEMGGGSNLGDSNGVDVPTLASAPSSPDQGQMYYNTGDDKLYVWDGSAWQEVGSGGGVSSSNAPSVYAHRNNANATVTAGAWNNVVFTHEDWDTTNDFDTSNGRFTPSVAGRYLVIVNTGCSLGTECFTSITKNGSSIAQNKHAHTHNGGVPSVAIVEMNGTTDYIHGRIMPVGTSTLYGPNSITNFSATYLGPIDGVFAEIQDADGDTKIEVEASADEDIIRFDTGGTERVQIAANGFVGIGTTTPDEKLSVHGDSWSSVESRVHSNSDYAGFILGRARGSMASATAVADNDSIGVMIARGYNGTGWGEHARIDFEVDGATIGVGDAPGRMVLKTTPDGTAVPLPRLTIRQDGNVGIGTSSPTARLSVAKTTSIATGSEEFGFHSSTSFGVADTGLKQGGRINAYASHTSGTVASLHGLLVTSENLGVGDVDNAYGVWTRAGNGAVGGTVDNSYGLYISYATTTGTVNNNWGLYQVDLNAKNYFAGSVGVGAATPGAKLEVRETTDARTAVIQNTAGTLNNDVLNIGTFDGGVGDTWNLLNIETGNSGTPGSGTSQFTVKATGNVGVGIANPSAKFHLRSNTGGSGARVTLTDATQSTFWLTDVTNDKHWQMKHTFSGVNRFGILNYDGSTWSEDFSILENGSVGVGSTSPSSKLHVVGVGGTTGGITLDTVAASSQANFEFRDAGVQKWAIYKTTTNDLRFYDFTGGDRMAILDSNGNVGIGTNAPDQKLSVNGNASKASGGTSWAVFSDARLKTVHGTYDRGLEEIRSLEPIFFSYDKDNPAGIEGHGEEIGFVAQDVQKVIPEAVEENDNGYLTINADPILWAMTNAIKELDNKCEMSAEQLASIESRVSENERKIASLEERVEELEQQSKEKDKVIDGLKEFLCRQNPEAVVCQN